MSVGPDNTFAVLLECEVVDESEERLKEEQNEDDDADDWMCFVHHARVSCHVQAHCESGDVE